MKPVPVGALKAMAIALPSTLDTALDGIATLNRAYLKASGLQVDAGRSREIKELSSALNRHGNEVLAAMRLLDQGSQFEANDFTVLCFAIEHKSERYRVAWAALSRLGNEVSRDQAKGWLLKKEEMLREVHGVKRIEPNDAWRGRDAQIVPSVKVERRSQR